jgi:hypothetical protein
MRAPIIGPLLRPLLQGLRDASMLSFAPSSLFTAGEQGAWYDPSDFNRYMQTGPELVTNGAFADGTTAGWVVSGGGATLAVSSGRMEVTSVSTPIAYTALATTVGRQYRATVRMTKGTMPNAQIMWASASAGAYSSGGTSMTVSGLYELVFIASASTTYLNLGFGETAAGQTVYYDDISVKELTSISTATMYQDSAGTTPVTAVGQPVGLMLDKRLGAVLGSEQITNGIAGFIDTAGWSGASANLSVVAGRLRITATGAGAFGATVPKVYTDSGTMWYRSVFTLGAFSAGSTGVIAKTRGGTNLSIIASGTYTNTALAGDNANTFAVFATAAAPGDYIEVASVSVKPLPGNHRTQSTAASRPTLSGRYNQIVATQDFAGASWVKEFAGTGTAPVVTDNYPSVAAPDGTFTATRLQLSKGAGATSADRSEVYQTVAGLSDPSTRKVWARSLSGTVGVVLLTSTGGVKTVTETWQEFTTAAPGVERPRFMLRGDIAGASNSADILIWHPDVRASADASLAIPSYQRVNTATDYDTTGFPLYLSYDGVDDWMQTASVDFSATDKMLVGAMVHKASDAAQAAFVGLGNITLAGGFEVFAPTAAAGNNFNFTVAGGTTFVQASSGGSYAAPSSQVLTGIGDISLASGEAILRLNGAVVATSAGSAGTGNFRADVLYFGRRGGTTLPFNGREYQVVICGAAKDAAQIARMERFLASRGGVAL